MDRILVTLAGLALIVLVNLYFFGGKRGPRRESRNAAQRTDVD